jgi:hypothetical protein
LLEEKEVTMYFELQPAYGRDYKTKAEVIKAWEGDQDFIGDYQMGFKPVNRSTIMEMHNGATVNLRYCGNRKVAVVKG